MYSNANFQTLVAFHESMRPRWVVYRSAPDAPCTARVAAFGLIVSGDSETPEITVRYTAALALERLHNWDALHYALKDLPRDQTMAQMLQIAHAECAPRFVVTRMSGEVEVIVRFMNTGAAARATTVDAALTSAARITLDNVAKWDAWKAFVANPRPLDDVSLEKIEWAC